MENQVDRNQTRATTLIVSITTIMNILATLFIGFVSYFVIGVGDPANDNVDIEAFIMQKHLELTVTKALTMFFIFGFIIALILWLMRKRYWNFILSGLALFHLLVLFQCINFVWLPTFFYLFSVLDLVIIVVMLLNRGWQYSSVRT